MAKPQRRKPPKRAPAKSVIHDDLATLIAVLDEERLDNDTSGWFELPWRDGWNAAMLARNAYLAYRHHDNDHVSGDIQYTLGQWISDRVISPAIYEQAGDAITQVAGLTLQHDLKATGLLLVGLRCAQITVANSSGGGVVFNELLRHRFQQLPVWWETSLKTEVSSARCWDAIGVGPELKNDINDRLRRAFRIAWNRGLYRAAYALPRAK